jgi:hypothetical protein
VNVGDGDSSISGVEVWVFVGNDRLVGVTRKATSVNWALYVAATLVVIDSVGAGLERDRLGRLQAVMMINANNARGINRFCLACI